MNGLYIFKQDQKVSKIESNSIISEETLGTSYPWFHKIITYRVDADRNQGSPHVF